MHMRRLGGHAGCGGRIHNDGVSRLQPTANPGNWVALGWVGAVNWESGGALAGVRPSGMEYE